MTVIHSGRPSAGQSMTGFLQAAERRARARARSCSRTSLRITSTRFELAPVDLPPVGHLQLDLRRVDCGDAPRLRRGARGRSGRRRWWRRFGGDRFGGDGRASCADGAEEGSAGPTP